MNNTNQHLPQDQTDFYRVQVDGKIDERMQAWFEDLTISTETRTDGSTISTLVSLVADQAALHGLLNRIYTWGLLIISVTRVEIMEPHNGSNNEFSDERK